LRIGEQVLAPIAQDRMRTKPGGNPTWQSNRNRADRRVFAIDLSYRGRIEAWPANRAG
jgi:hypothetical protein